MSDRVEYLTRETLPPVGTPLTDEILEKVGAMINAGGYDEYGYWTATAEVLYTELRRLRSAVREWVIAYAGGVSGDALEIEHFKLFLLAVGRAPLLPDQVERVVALKQRTDKRHKSYLLCDRCGVHTVCPECTGCIEHAHHAAHCSRPEMDLGTRIMNQQG